MGAPDLFFIDSWKEWYLAVGAVSTVFRDFKARGTGGKIAEGVWYTVTWPVAVARGSRKTYKELK